MTDAEHLEGVEKLLATGASWRAVGEKLGMSGELAVMHYAHHAARELNRLRGENSRLKEAMNTEPQPPEPELSALRAKLEDFSTALSIWKSNCAVQAERLEKVREWGEQKLDADPKCFCPGDILTIIDGKEG